MALIVSQKIETIHCTEMVLENWALYLDARRKEWRQVLLHIVSDNPIYLLHICNKLLLKKQSRIFRLNVAHNINWDNWKIGRRRTETLEKHHQESDDNAHKILFCIYMHTFVSEHTCMDTKVQMQIYIDKNLYIHTYIYHNHLSTWVILPNNDVGAGGFRAAVPLLAFKLRWSKNNNVDVLVSQ